MTEDLRFGPEMELPLINAKLSLADLVAKDSAFKVNNDNRITIKYVEDSIFSFNALDFVRIPEQDGFAFPLSALINPFDLEMSVGTLGGVKLAETYFSKGYLNFDISTNSPFPAAIDVEVTIKNGDLGGQPMSKIVRLPPGASTVSDSLDISGGKIDLSSGGVNFIGLKADILNPGGVIPQTEPLTLGCRFSALEIQSANGDFGQRFVNIPTGAFDFDVSGLSDLMNGLYLTNPEIRLISESNIGIDLNLEPDFDGSNDVGDIVPLGAQIQSLTAPASANSFKIDTLKFNRGNSNIVDFIAALPSSILYAGRAEINPAGGTSTNFISSDSRMKMGVEINLPLEIQADNLILEQTLEGLDFLQENPEEVESLNLIFNTKNGFPFDVNLSLAFLDSITNDSIDGINIQLLVAPPVDGDGKVISRSNTREVLMISEEALDNLKRSKNLRLRARLSTPNNGQEIVTFYTDYDLEVNIATQVKLNVKL